MQRKLGFLKRGASNQEALKGIVKNYKMFTDYTLPQTQPWYTVDHLKWQINKMKRKLVVDLNIFTPHYMCIAIIAISMTGYAIRMVFYNRAPTIFITQGDLKNRDTFAYHFAATANPDHYFDALNMCWSSDPLCGLDVAPKRPQESLKDPKKNLMRFNWDNTINPHVAMSGGYY